jgi:hypothetical protein
MSKMRTLLLLTLTGLFLGACATAPVAADPAELTLVPRATTAIGEGPLPTPVPTRAGPIPTQSALLQAIEEQARFDLSRWFGLSDERITLVSAEEVEWPDAALGCPQPGMTYAQVITPGYRLTLQAGGETYLVHADLEGHAVLCGDEAVPLSPVFPVTPGEIDDGSPWLPVD